MKLRPLFFLVLWFLVARPALAQHCREAIPTTPISLADKLVDLGNGSFYFAGEIEERNLRLTLLEFRKAHPGLAITDVAVQSSRISPCYNYLSNVTLRTAPAREQPAPKTATLSISVSPWATVIWANALRGEATNACPLVLENLPCGTYTFRFESDAFDPVTRSIKVCGKNVSMRIDLYEEAPTKIKLK